MARLMASLGLAVLLLCGPAQAQDSYEGPRQRMVKTIEAIARQVGGRRLPQVIDAAVLDAMRRVPRHRFVPEERRPNAYEDRPLGIGYGQTISQPYIVALMSHLLEVEPGDKVLELGTGSGYQAAVLSAMGIEVASVEIVPPLAERAAETLKREGHDNVEVRAADGYYGWPEKAPFDAVIVTAAAPHIPPPLIEQLKRGGRMVIPVGPAYLTQQLVLVHKDLDGGVRSEAVLPVAFVPLTGSGH